MRVTTTEIATLVICAVGLADAAALHPKYPKYKRGSAADGDSRSPCPALNALANHGILPRNGKAITAAQLSDAVQQTYNLDSTMAYVLGYGALPLVVNSTLDFFTKSTLDLADLNMHDAIEHDASLSRKDFSQGDNYSVQKDLLAALLADSTTETLSLESLAKSRARREKDAATRGQPKLGFKANTFAYGEAALLLLTMSKSGNASEPLAPKEFVRAWVGEEKLPDGWVKPTNPITLSQTSSIANRIQSMANAVKG